MLGAGKESSVMFCKKFPPIFQILVNFLSKMSNLSALNTCKERYHKGIQIRNSKVARLAIGRICDSAEHQTWTPNKSN